VPTDQEVEAKKTDRLVALLAQEASAVSADDVEDLRKVADAICAHPDRHRLIAHLIQRDIAVVEDTTEEADEPAAEPAAPSEPKTGRRRRRGRRRGGKRED
jgi:hypothetical protein